MNTSKKSLLIAIAILATGLLLAQRSDMRQALAQLAAPVVERWVVASGGGVASGGNVAIQDTLGQPIVGSSTGGQIDIESGFWNSTPVVYRMFMPWVSRR
jgi:hypothetical protein